MFRKITNDKQYIEYCNLLEKLTDSDDNSDSKEEQIKLLTILIEEWDKRYEL